MAAQNYFPPKHSVAQERADLCLSGICVRTPGPTVDLLIHTAPLLNQIFAGALLVLQPKPEGDCFQNSCRRGPICITGVPLPPCSRQPLSAAPVPGIALRHAFLPFSAWSGNLLSVALSEAALERGALGPVLKEDGNRESSHKGSGEAETRPREDKHPAEPCSCNKYRRKKTWREGPS